MSEIVFEHRDGNVNVHEVRREGQVPGILYGDSGNNILVKISQRDLEKEIIREGSHTLKTIELDGQKRTVVIKELQRDPVSNKIIHIDLEDVKPDQIVTAELPVRFLKDKTVNKSAGILQTERSKVRVKAPASKMPEFLNVTIDPQISTVYRISDIEAAEEISFLDNKDTVLASLMWNNSSEITDAEEDQEQNS